MSIISCENHISESLCRAEADGERCSAKGKAIGTVTAICAGQAPSPDVIPWKVSLQGNGYTASGAVTRHPEDNCISVVVVARNIHPPRCSKGCRLAQSGKDTWLRENVSLDSELKGKPSHVILVAKSNPLGGQTKVHKSTYVHRLVYS